MADKVAKAQFLNRCCQTAQAAIREVVEAEHIDDNELLTSLTECPLKPWVIAQASALLIYKIHKTAVLAGRASGEGILITRLPTTNETLIRWSAPLFFKIKLGSFGLSLGKSVSTCFAVAMQKETITQLIQGHKVFGIDVNMTCGTRILDSSDVIAANAAEDFHTVGMTKKHGGMIDFSFTGGSMKLDMEKHALAYGDVTPAQIIAGKIEGPAELQPLYGELSLMVHGETGNCPSPARVSASLERFSMGRDPEQVMVLNDGSVSKEK